MTAPRSADADELRRTIARIPAPVTVVTTYVDDRPVGFTASSFVNISVDPPLVGVLVAETARSYAAFEQAEHVAINVLAESQSGVATTFAGRGLDKFRDVELDDHTHAPVLRDAMGVLLCRVDQRPVLGDHLMLVLHVEDVWRHTHAPLVYQDRQFRTLTDLHL